MPKNLAPDPPSRHPESAGRAKDLPKIRKGSSPSAQDDGGVLTSREAKISKLILKEISSRLGFLDEVGLNYLTLDRAAATLSGGEAQRIRLATQIGSKLRGVLYVLDEPSIGLHPRDNQKLIRTMTELRDLGNSVLVVEHDEETMRAADFIVEIGPGAGKHGGEIVAAGPPEDFFKSDAETAKFLDGRESIPTPRTRRPGNGLSLTVRGAAENNLQNLDARIPLGCLVGVTGVSGSGKSTLIHDILVRALAQKYHRAHAKPGAHRSIAGLENLDKLVSITQDPIGRTPRSNPATYTGLFTPIRDLFAAMPLAKQRGWKAGRFSFNVRGGRCEACQGDGVKKIEMHFLPDVYVPCEECDGRRYNSETLEVKFREKSIADVLEMTVAEARELFASQPAISGKLDLLDEVGLGYVHLGQSAVQLSGGEAQRVKLATELSKRPTGKTLYVLDEPTTGLHFSDVRRLLAVLHRLVDAGNSVLVIEHNLDVIRSCDWLLDLGPGGGAAGGRLVAEGTPETVSKNPASETGGFLAGELKKHARR